MGDNPLLSIAGTFLTVAAVPQLINAARDASPWGLIGGATCLIAGLCCLHYYFRDGE